VGGRVQHEAERTVIEGLPERELDTCASELFELPRAGPRPDSNESQRGSGSTISEAVHGETQVAECVRDGEENGADRLTTSLQGAHPIIGQLGAYGAEVEEQEASRERLEPLPEAERQHTSRLRCHATLPPLHRLERKRHLNV